MHGHEPEDALAMTTRTTHPLPADAVDALRRALSGRVVTPADADWEAERHGWNLCVDQRPCLVAHVADADDVATAVDFARRHGVAASAQPVGHGATTALDGAVLLRTGRLQEIVVDVDNRTARVGAGVRWQQLNEALTGTGLTSLPGSSGDPSVVGYTLGGGVSWFGRAYGIAAGSVRAVELVGPDGRSVRVTGESDPELFWALRGGGGDFGIVTSLEIGLYPAEHVYGGRLVWSAEHAADVFAAYLGVTASAPDALTAWARLLNLPDVDPVPTPLRGRWTVAVDVTYLGSRDGAERLLAPLRGLPAPLVGGLGTVPLAGLSDVCAEPTDPVSLVDTGMLLDGFGAGAVEALLDAVLRGPEPAPLALIGIRHLGGAFTRPTSDPGAIDVVPQAYALIGGGPAPTPGQLTDVRAAINRVHAAMEPYDSGRHPPNFGDVERIHAPDALARLRDVKRQRDPVGVIRSNRPVLPTGG